MKEITSKPISFDQKIKFSFDVSNLDDENHLYSLPIHRQMKRFYQHIRQHPPKKEKAWNPKTARLKIRRKPGAIFPREPFKTYSTNYNITTENTTESIAELRNQYMDQLPTHIQNKTHEENTTCQAYLGLGCEGSKVDTLLLLNILWILIIGYFFLAFCFWCTKGWSCCCIPLQICKVSERLQTIQLYLARNPPGILNEKETCYRYEPSAAEVHLYEEMTSALLNI